MTDRDEIELPPLPPFMIAPIADKQTVRDYARAAVLADRERRPCVGASEGDRIAELRDELYDLKNEIARCRKERDAARAEQAQPAKPKVYSTTVCLSSTGLTVWPMTSDDCCATITLRWTDGGRAWIESERNRGLAKELRRLYSAGASIHCVTAADALDGARDD